MFGFNFLMPRFRHISYMPGNHAHKYRYNWKGGFKGDIAGTTHMCGDIHRRARFYIILPRFQKITHCNTTTSILSVTRATLLSRFTHPHVYTPPPCNRYKFVAGISCAENPHRDLPQGYPKVPWRSHAAESPRYAQEAPCRSNVSEKGGRYWSGHSLVCGQTKSRFSPASRVPLWSGSRWNPCGKLIDVPHPHAQKKQLQYLMQNVGCLTP